MQPSHKPFQKPARRAFEDGGSPGSLLKGNSAQDPLAGQYGHAAVGAPVDQGAAMDRKVLAQNAASVPTSSVTPPEEKLSLRPGAQAALNSFQPIPMPTIGYANGGMLGSLMRLTGLAEDTPERKAYKASREAEKAAGKAKPAPKETPAPMGSQSVLDRRMAEAGLANGGKIKGPGTPTSDSIPAQVAQTGEPIKVSTGERIVSAAQDALLQKIAKARGYKSVDHMFEAETGKPVGPTIKGGARAAEGGASQDDLKKRVAQIPAGGSAPAPDGISTGNDFTRNVNNSLNALGGMGVVSSVPLRAAQSASTALKGLNSLSVVAPVAKTTNVALQEGAKANQMASGVRAFGNASAGAGMLDGQQTPLVQPAAPAQPAAPSLKAPWYLPEYARAANASELGGLELEKARRAAANPAAVDDPLKNLLLNGAWGATDAAQANPSPAAPGNYRGKGYLDPRQAGMGQPGGEPGGMSGAAPVDEFSNAAIAQRNPGGVVRKVVGADGRTSYSGSNVAGDVSFQGADGKALSGRPGGGFMLAQGMSQDAIKSALTNPDGSAWSAGDNAIMAANLRDGVDKYRGTSRDPRNDPMNQPMTKDQRAARVRLAETASQDKRYAETNKIAQGQLDISQKDHIFKQDQAKLLATTQDVFADPKTPPAQREAARLKLIAMGSLKENGEKYVTNVVKSLDGSEQLVVTNSGTGEIKGGPQGAQAAPTPRADYDKLPKGSAYTGTDGKQYTKG